MKRAQGEKYIVAALLVVFVVVFVKGPLANRGLFSRPTPPAATMAPTSVTVTTPAPTAATQPADQDIVQSSEPPVGRERKAAYAAHDLRDPFESLLPAAPRPEPVITQDASAALIEREGREWATAMSSSPPPLLNVTGMLWGGTRPKAIINGEVYQVDDVVEGSKVVAIDDRGVTIEHNGTLVRLKPASAFLQ